MKNNNEMKIKVDINKEIYNKDDFYTYVGWVERSYKGLYSNQELSITTNGFELRPGVTTLVGTLGNYRGKPSFKCLYEEFDSSSYESKYNLLCSIKGIKDNTAKKILDNIPNNDIEIFYNKEVPKIKGIGPSTIKKIHEGLNFLRDNQNLKNLIALIGNSISNKKIHLLNMTLSNQNISIEEFKSDPYEILIEDIEMNFKKVDYLAQEKFKCSKNLRSRLIYLSEQIVNTITGFGNTYIDIDLFTEKLDSYNLQYDNLNQFIDCDDSKIINDNGRVQTKLMAQSEKQIPIYLDELNENSVSKHELINLDLLIREYEAKNGIILHDVQKKAVKSAIENNTSMICGGAGTGKTTIIKCIIYVLKKLNYMTLCTAPTGKASRRMSEATGQSAFTCHRFYFAEESASLLGETPWHNNKNNVMIIDEFSMVDSILFYKILKNMSESKTNYTKLILVGDPGQLPSVGAGNVMADIIESKVINIVTLTNTFRQAEGSKIIEIANKVRNNQTFELIKTSDFFGTIQNDVNSYILRCWISKYGKISDLDTLYNDFQICTSSRRRCNEINNIIRNEMKNQPILMFNKDCGFSLNDKVMNTKNDYTNDIYNGEFGRIEKITYKLGEMDFEIKTNEELKKYYDNKTFGKNLNFVVYYSGLNKSVSYELANDELENFQLAYCCTIHKLQGSEFQTVLCDVSEFNMITDSRLLYTAITRAKNLFVLVSNEKTTIDKIIKNKLSSKRKTLLVERLDPTKETKEIDNISGNGFIIN